ncbi:hypothetical protein C8A05DRAFT_17914 [Staphylotrichum tortipilum]|uniref:Methyltransferase domain-containing protein n=1 Tax=Staphylotrichum tortipilum TaxID=2831512 RepID=A0AAN6MGC8_9PEZI|nr:hypothetical protein C8A05DRAFT_17914 [Staphylotrichum longicolle]
MEFLSGYAAAKAPYLTYEVEGSPPSRSKPTRTNSTAGTSSKKKRSRIPGHARTNSASTSSSGGQTDPHHAHAHAGAAASLHPSSGGGAGAGGPGGGDATTTGAPLTLTLSAGDSADQHHHHNHHHQQQQHPKTRRSSSTRDRDRMHSSLKYFQDKQLPATPRLNTHDLSLKHPGGASSTSTGAAHADPASARTPASASAVATFGNPGAVVAAVAFPDHRRSTAGPHTSSSSMAPYPDMISSGRPGGARAESISSVSGATTTSNRTMHSGEQAHDSAYQLRPFVVRNGRTYLADPTLPYPLPVDLEELHRQSLKTMLLMQLFGGPICAPGFADKPPLRVLEVGCGTGFWSMMCYKHYEARGQAAGMSFTGIDIVSLPPNSASASSSPSSGDLSADTRPDKDMSWRFVQHDLRKLPLPFPAGSFDFVMVKDMTLVVSLAMQQSLIEEYVRILSPGGAVEIWETDHVVRMLRPHVPDCATTSGGPTDDENTISPSTTIPPPVTTTTQQPDDDKQTALGGAYIMTGNTPLSTPLNNFLVDYNHWALRALESRSLCAMPCTAVGPLLVQEAEDLTGLGSRRLAVPLSEIRWEREGVGGVVTKDGKSYIETKTQKTAGGKGMPPPPAVKEGGGGGKGLEPAAAALRRTALLTVVQQIQSLEPMLREVAGKSQDEWDTWLGKMMNDLVRENGTNWGECLEVGAWWARRR